MIWRRLLTAGLALAVLASPVLWFFYPGWVFYIYSGNPHAANVKARQAVPYKVLYEDMGSLIQVAVPASISEEQLRATLVEVANEEQDVQGRDYLMSEYLCIQVYLTQNGKRSEHIAGSLMRYVPWKNPEQRKRMRVDRSMFDKFEISLPQARSSF